MLDGQLFVPWAYEGGGGTALLDIRELTEPEALSMGASRETRAHAHMHMHTHSEIPLV